MSRELVLSLGVFVLVYFLVGVSSRGRYWRRVSRDLRGVAARIPDEKQIINSGLSKNRVTLAGLLRYYLLGGREDAEDIPMDRQVAEIWRMVREQNRIQFISNLFWTVVGVIGGYLIARFFH